MSIAKVVKLEEKLATRLERLSGIKERSPHWLMKTAIQRFVDQEEEREALKSEALRRWEEAEQGKVVSNHAVMQWLESWDGEHERKRPKCKS